MSPQSFDKQIETITKDGLVFLPILRSKAYSGFSHRHYPVYTIDNNTFVFGVVAKNLEIAQKFHDASVKGNHLTQGELLGYPKCCREAFHKHWSKMILDPCYESAINTKGATVDKNTVQVRGNPYLNTMLRYFGIKIIPFFTCSYKCNKALEVGKVWYKVMESLDKNVAHSIKEVLEQPLTWSLNKNIIYIKTPIMKATVNGYECDHRKEIQWK